MKALTTFLFFLTVGLSAEILIIHEKRLGVDWVTDYTVVENTSEIDAAIKAINEADEKRLKTEGFNIFAVFPLAIEAVESDPVFTWQSAGGFTSPDVFVFWGNADTPDTVVIEPFGDRATAEIFVNEIEKDDTRILHAQPFEATEKFTLQLSPGSITYKLKVP